MSDFTRELISVTLSVCDSKPSTLTLSPSFLSPSLSLLPLPLSLPALLQLSQYQEGGDQDGSLSAPSEEYEELDPLEKEWMLACASGDLDTLLNIIIRDDTLINRKDFLHGVSYSCSGVLICMRGPELYGVLIDVLISRVSSCPN